MRFDSFKYYIVLTEDWTDAQDRTKVLVDFAHLGRTIIGNAVKGTNLRL